MNNALQNLPPELQERIAGIMAQGQAPAPTAPPLVQNAPQERAVAKPPSLVDHVVALRHEVASLQAAVNAQGQVVEAVGNAVGQMYAMFQPTTTQPDPSSTYSVTFQNSVEDVDY